MIRINNNNYNLTYFTPISRILNIAYTLSNCETFESYAPMIFCFVHFLSAIGPLVKVGKIIALGHNPWSYGQLKVHTTVYFLSWVGFIHEVDYLTVAHAVAKTTCLDST